MTVVGQSLKNQLKSNLVLSLIISLGATFVVNIMALIFPSFWSNMLIGKTTFSLSPTFQDIMWMISFMGVMLIIQRMKYQQKVARYINNKYLPEDFQTIIDDSVLTEIVKKTKKDAHDENGVLPYMILQICLQFRTNNSISLTTDFLSKQLELFLHGIELGYNKLKYIIWLIPSIGFMGTVYGIGLAVSELGSGSLDDPELLTKMAKSLGVAFNTTLLALILSVILQFFVQHYEAKEEQEINKFGKYILDNLINKLIEKK